MGPPQPARHTARPSVAMPRRTVARPRERPVSGQRSTEPAGVDSSFDHWGPERRLPEPQHRDPAAPGAPGERPAARARRVARDPAPDPTHNGRVTHLEAE